jgi:catechol 2,3-dioxygenase-like lactoylglutathione lyase family enzyme
MHVLQIDHVEMFVPNREETAQWYRDVLGLEVVEEFRFWAAGDGGPLMISTRDTTEQRTITPGQTVPAGTEGWMTLPDAPISERAQGLVVSTGDGLFVWGGHDSDNKTEVVIGGMKVPKITDCASENGWTYVEPEPYGAIEICGTACDELKIAGDADINYYCDAG